MCVFLHIISFCYGKLSARLAKTADAITVLQTAIYAILITTTALCGCCVPFIPDLAWSEDCEDRKSVV